MSFGKPLQYKGKVIFSDDKLVNRPTFVAHFIPFQKN